MNFSQDAKSFTCRKVKTINVKEKGQIQLGGRALPKGRLKIYLNGDKWRKGMSPLFKDLAINCGRGNT